MRTFVLMILCVWYSSVNAQVNKATSDSSFECHFPCNSTIPAKFPGGLKAWAKYLRHNTNSRLGSNYIVIPKNKLYAKATVYVNFRISKWGYVDTVFAIQDRIKIHPNLVAEAIRVIKASPRWIAARLNNKRVDFYNRQAITWQVDKE